MDSLPDYESLIRRSCDEVAGSYLDYLSDAVFVLFEGEDELEAGRLVEAPNFDGLIKRTGSKMV